MKTFSTTRVLAFAALLGLAPGCKSFLDKDPLGTVTQINLFNDATNATQAVNAVYDVTGWDQGRKFGVGEGVTVSFEWMFGDILSDDAEKGSSSSDFAAITELKNWSTPTTNAIIASWWVNNFTGIARANIVINNIDAGSIDAALKARLKGEAQFLRAFFYFNLVKTFGGMPLFEQAVLPTDAANVKRSTIAETYAFIEKDLKAAAAVLPEKGAYASADAGRATKGAANGYLARVIMYQLGTDNTNKHTWQEVYDLTSAVISSGQYSLLTNYAAIHQNISENSSESVFEIQFAESNDSYGSISTGTSSNVFQNNRATFGYGFNIPTQSLYNEFEANDPRREVTFIKGGDVVLGVVNPIDTAFCRTGYLNRKVAITPPASPQAAGQNLRKLRYADILLMKAEAAAQPQLGLSGEAIGLVNQVRLRARTSTRPPGTSVGSTTYAAANTPAGTLPDLAGLSGQALLNAIWHERRVEFGEESLRYWDLVRTGRYFGILSPSVATQARLHSITTGVVNPIPLLPIELQDATTWGIAQNPGY